jgi:hypothetical protein
MDTFVVVMIVIIVLIIIIAIVVLAVLFLGKQTTTTVGLNGVCAGQVNCDAGFVCSNNPANNNTVCKSGIGNICTTTADCATSLACIPVAGTAGTINICLVPPAISEVRKKGVTGTKKKIRTIKVQKS